MFKSMACALTVVALAVMSPSLAHSQEAAAPTAPPALKIVPPAPTVKTVATVGDRKITSTELDDMVRSQLQGRPVPPEVMPQIRSQILQSMIDNILVTQFVAAKGVKAEPADVEAMIANIKKQLADTGVELATVLKARGMTEQTMREQIASEMAVEKYVKSAVTDEQAQAYFNAHKKEFDGTQVKASHILLEYEPDSPAADKKAANDKIAAIRKQIVEGADFAEAAKANSACPSKAEGGDLGFFARHGQMVEPFAAAAFALEKDGLSQPVETQFGVHLIKTTDIKPGEKKFEDAKDTVLRDLYQKVLEKAVQEQRKVTKVEILN